MVSDANDIVQESSIVPDTAAAEKTYAFTNVRPNTTYTITIVAGRYLSESSTSESDETSANADTGAVVMKCLQIFLAVFLCY